MADWHNLQNNETDSSKKNVELFPLRSRRSPIICRNGCVSSSQPLASSVGLHVLRDLKGNAADAAIAMAAVLAVTEPCSTGLGGDMFALWYDSSTSKVEAINGSGCSPSGLTHEMAVVQNSDDPNFKISPHMVTVPGAAKGWEGSLRKWGSEKLTFKQLLEPAIQYARDGFPVAPVTAHHWNEAHTCVQYWYDQLQESSEEDAAASIPFTVKETGEPPKAGDIFTNPDLANVLEELGNKGATEGFYQGFPGQAIVNTLNKLGGVMTQEDLSNHISLFPDPISVSYKEKVKLWQVPPNGQGIAGLIALKGIEALEDVDMSTSSQADRYHCMMEMMRLGFKDARQYVCDPTTLSSNKDGKEGSLEWLLDSDRIQSRAKDLFNPHQAVILDCAHTPPSGTVSFQVVDSDGNAISFVNSNFMGFGTGIVPSGCGFSLQNRGFGFNWKDKNHPNFVSGNKRPYHTIIPGMLTHADSGQLYATLSNMGGFMQPQGHLQLTINMVDRGLDPQTAVDEPRFCIADGTFGGTAFLEPGVSVETEATLLKRGHNLRIGASEELRGLFGKAQVIKRDPNTGVLWAGSDGRSDGCAMGY